ncbi:hypothetical protein SDC9_196050 [bioreactor metagenome]|uniref:Uncharacterized protein n=1 Tax=bioreactor metagenome TaxID=1076179 RepID=A0A645IMA3_9ZZZZ
MTGSLQIDCQTRYSPFLHLPREFSCCFQLIPSKSQPRPESHCRAAWKDGHNPYHFLLHNFHNRPPPFQTDTLFHRAKEAAVGIDSPRTHRCHDTKPDWVWLKQLNIRLPLSFPILVHQSVSSKRLRSYDKQEEESAILARVILFSPGNPMFPHPSQQATGVGVSCRFLPTRGLTPIACPAQR